MNKEKAKELLHEWKERLGLQEWAISLAINVPIKDLDENDGNVVYDTSLKVARIKIAVENEDERNWVKYDFEKILIHELMHIKVGLLDFDTVNSYEQKLLTDTIHQLVEDIAQALMMTKYNKKGRQINRYKEEIIDEKGVEIKDE